MRKWILAMFVPTLLVICVCVLNPSTTMAQQITAVSSVDLKRFNGQWFEIAKLPVKFQKQCVGNTTATFNLKENGNIAVLNSCLTKNGKVEGIRGEAIVSDKNTNAKMKISSTGFSSDSYWIIDLDPNYNYAAIGSPDRKFVWVLSRSPKMDDAIYQQILRRIEKMGYNPNKFAKTPQNVEMLKGVVIEKQ